MLEQVTVLIGISCGNKAIAGVVHQPFYAFAPDKDYSQMGRTLWAAKGCGVHGANAKPARAGASIAHIAND